MSCPAAVPPLSMELLMHQPYGRQEEGFCVMEAVLEVSVLWRAQEGCREPGARTWYLGSFGVGREAGVVCLC